ncbi:MAG: hypothetical protein JGK24_30650 [Microcoleus sp. PH2017_29_MFU_D_A]|jgi:hypothetical protein|uniref:hypothetical protein n=1 Tax=unclassified Microcoleus TaxID=2642155 RepID=UPI001D79B473|nr:MULTISPECIES: hypothetical protein [unclassified Microcoleus]MCC3422247.1 hypothetical protein [Microcoleus sp. PH2017_07_MST_O_A]MCC3513747.1 hypothetical protein [Microcoleus sp. PH2017_17_BER_D_A]TAE62177.1 MAG: hypothetical protein EAZ86_31745 [Oscillatoriales cyanobacterium]MCC3440028.1 hypothetical protein [Microcoleus sp. PH2017_05_CCC_O_A]MCC3458000.1 hypothetical protein [Microcoleus sp. PH2017_08_TRC_O_A]
MTNSLLEQLKQASLQRIDGRWQLLATAAGNEESIRQTLRGLDVNELRLDTDIALPSNLVEDRVLALSVSRPELLRNLLNQWEMEPRTGDPYLDSGCLDIALKTARRCLMVVEIDRDAEPWLWDEHLKPTYMKETIRLLARRPLISKVLTQNDIENAILCGGNLLLALRTQEVQIEESVFAHYADSIISTGPYVTALLIELSRRTNFDSRVWFERILEVFPTISDPLDLTLSTYALLNDQWVMPW